MKNIEQRLTALEREADANPAGDWVRISYPRYDSLRSLRWMKLVGAMQAWGSGSFAETERGKEVMEIANSVRNDETLEDVPPCERWEGAFKPGARFFITRERLEWLPTEEECEEAVRMAKQDDASFVLKHWANEWVRINARH